MPERMSRPWASNRLCWVFHCDNSAGGKVVVNYSNPKWVNMLTAIFWPFQQNLVFCFLNLSSTCWGFQYLHIQGPLLTLQGGSAACSDSALSHRSNIKLPLELWAIIPVAEQHSFAWHGPFCMRNCGDITIKNFEPIFREFSKVQRSLLESMIIAARKPTPVS